MKHVLASIVREVDRAVVPVRSNTRRGELGPRCQEWRRLRRTFLFNIARRSRFDALRLLKALSLSKGGRPTSSCNPPSTIYNPQSQTGGIAQLVERQLCKLEVRGSNPLASSPESFRGCRAGALAKADLFEHVDTVCTRRYDDWVAHASRVSGFNV